MIVRMMDPIASSEGFEPRIFVGPNAQREANLYCEVAVWNRVTFREIDRMLKIAIYGTENVPPEMKEPLADQARLNEPEYLKNGLPNDFAPTTAQLLEIRERALRSIEWRAEHEADPVKKLEWQAVLAAAEERWTKIEEAALAQLKRRWRNG
jgi:hypothetical protein